MRFTALIRCGDKPVKCFPLFSLFAAFVFRSFCVFIAVLLLVLLAARYMEIKVAAFI